jgi:putative flavoprotein involved in K+ transport
MRTTAVIIGAGQAGLAMSRCLTERSIDHVVLERGEVANTWKTERWDSLRLLTPNWQSRLPGYGYEGDDPDGYRTMPETIDFLRRYADVISAPVQTRTAVTSVRRTYDGFEILTNRGIWRCEAVVIATGAFNIPTLPAVAEAVPNAIDTLTARRRRGDGRRRRGLGSTDRRGDPPLGTAGNSGGRRAHSGPTTLSRQRHQVVDGRCWRVG